MGPDVDAIRGQFPFLHTPKTPIAYLDSASTTQKPTAVLDAMQHFYTEMNANVHRGVYPRAEAATLAYKQARKTVADFIGAEAHEIIFTKNATEAINLVARSWGDGLKKDDAIALSIMEHHSNIIPWHQAALRTGAKLAWVNVDEKGELDMPRLIEHLETGKVKIVAISGLSNVLGALPDLHTIITRAHEHGARVLVDASQLVAHHAIHVQTLDCDFLVFSGHKLYGPMGIGILYGKAELLETMPPFLGGGDMIQSVTTEGFIPAGLPRKFEAGTPPAAEAVGLAAAIRWIESVGAETMHRHMHDVLSYAMQRLLDIEGLHILGTHDMAQRAGCISFIIDGIHPHDLTDILGQEGVCLRAGHHCTQPLHNFLGINASARLSVGAYNMKEEIDRCVSAMERARQRLSKQSS
jgi:cysteine desulfurase/selenocysteine lyase